MKKIISILLFLLLLPPLAHASDGGFNKKLSLTPSSRDTLVFDATFAEVNIEHWDKPRLDIECDVRVTAKSGKKVQSLLDAVEFEAIKSGRKTGAKVNLRSSTNFNGNSERYKITMTVKAPKGYPMRVNTQFGDVYGDDFDAPLTVYSQYGKVCVGNVHNISLRIQFGSKCSVSSARNIAISNEYSDIAIGRADTLRASDSFGKIKVGRLSAAGLGLAYSEFVSTDIIRSLRANAQFSKIRIARLAPDFRLVEVDGQYSKLNIGIPAGSSFDLTTRNMEYGKCRIKGLRTKVLSDENDEWDYDSSRRNKASKKQLLQINGGGGGRILFDGGNFSDITITASDGDDI